MKETILEVTGNKASDVKTTLERVFWILYSMEQRSLQAIEEGMGKGQLSFAMLVCLEILGESMRGKKCPTCECVLNPNDFSVLFSETHLDRKLTYGVVCDCCNRELGECQKKGNDFGDDIPF